MSEKKKPFSFAHLNPFAAKSEDDKDKGKDAKAEGDDEEKDDEESAKAEDGDDSDDENGGDEEAAKKDAKSSAAAKARSDERRRWAGVLSNKAAAANLPLACNLLGNTSLSAAQITAALKDAGPAASAAAPPQKGNPLALQEMDAAKSPHIGAGPGGDGKADAGAFILAAMGLKA